MGIYAILRLKVVKSPSVFVQQAASACQINTCSACDVNGDGVFNSKDTPTLKQAWEVNNCNNFSSAWGWCYANCSTPQTTKTQNYTCQSQVFLDAGCQTKTFEFKFQSDTNQSTTCSKWPQKPTYYITTQCQKN